MPTIIRSLLLLFAVLATPATAQIRVLNPFAHPQGSVAALVTAASATDCVAPTASASTGLVPRTGNLWNGRKWDMNNALSWNHNVPDAVCWSLTSDYVRFTLHDTPFDRGQSDPSTKRRDEVSTPKQFFNGVEYWAAHSFKAHINYLKPGLAIRDSQFHWPSGASPMIGTTIVYLKGGLGFRVTTKNDGTDNVVRVTVPLTMDQPHDEVVHFKSAGANGFVDVYLDGKQILHFAGFIGSVKENGYGMRFGGYGTITGMSSVVEYKNLTWGTANLSARVLAPSAW